jgi:hypothetical protein
MTMPAHPDGASAASENEGDHGAALPIGVAVITRDGHRLGQVKEANERCFLIDVRLAFDYWLSTRAVAAVREDDVLLGIDKCEVSSYLVDTDCLDDFEDLPPVPEQAVGGSIQPAPA